MEGKILQLKKKTRRSLKKLTRKGISGRRKARDKVNKKKNRSLISE